VVVPWIGGQRLVVQRGMTGATGSIYAGLHEFADMAFLLHFLRPHDLFFDIGANVGSYTVLASGVCKATTWAFEPDPITVSRLQRNIAINKLQNLVAVHSIALGRDERNVPFTIGRDTENKIAENYQPNVRVICQKPLDSLLTGSWPVMIKMDVEGYEPNVLEGAQGLLRNNALKVIESETVSEEMQRTLHDAGFVRMIYHPFPRLLKPLVGIGNSSNALFVRDIEFVRKRLISARKISVYDVSF
jgi:FkbM family methyltransferase